MQTTFTKYFFFSSIFGLALALLFPLSASATDCGNDPIYERSWTGENIVGARVRSIACMEGSDILTVLPVGTRFSIIAETDGWYKVKAGDKIGWVGATLINVINKSQSSTDSTVTPSQPSTVPSDIVGIDEDNFDKLQSHESGLLRRLKNKIVLRVHYHGQAYLVNDDGTLRLLTAKEVKAYKAGLKIEKKSEKQEDKPQTALKIRKLIGMDEANFAKLQAGDTALHRKFNDMLILRVYSHGEVYWVSPDGGLKFLTKGEIGYYLTQNLRPDSNSLNKTENKNDQGLPNNSTQSFASF